VSVQTPLQIVWPFGQPHDPLAHEPLFGQTVPQLPQLRASVWVFTQTPLQSVVPLVQTHTPPTQAVPPPQW